MAQKSVEKGEIIDICTKQYQPSTFDKYQPPSGNGLWSLRIKIAPVLSEETAQTCVGLTDTPWGLVYCLALEIKSSQKLIQAVKLSIEKNFNGFSSKIYTFYQKYILIIKHEYLWNTVNQNSF